jgi:O-antigen/teichoic acid export membrane protein
MIRTLAKNTRNEILWSTFVQYAGKIINIALGIISVKILTNAIGLNEYGVYGQIAEYALFFSVVANLGIFGNTVRKMSEAPQDGKLFINSLFLRIITAGGFFLAGTLYAWLFIPERAFLIGTLFFMASLLADYVTSICNGMLQANYLMGRAVTASIIGRITNLGIILFLAKLGQSSAIFFFLAPLGASIITAGLSLIFVRLHIRFTWQLDWPLLKMLFLTALPFGIINILNNLYYRFLPSFAAAKILTDAQFGSYTISLHIATTVSLLSTYLMYSVLPAFKRALRDGKFTSAYEIFHKIKIGLIALSILTVAIGSWAAPFAISLVSSKEYFLPELWFILPLMLVLASVSYFYDLVLITLFALEKDLWFLKRELAALLLGTAILTCAFLPIILPETFPTNTPTQTALILTSAILAEALIVWLGLRKIKIELVTTPHPPSSST